MSDAQLETLRRLNSDFNSGGDWPRHYDPDVQLRMPSEWPDDAVYYGKNGLLKALLSWRAGFDEYHWREERLIDAEDCVVGLYYMLGKPKHAGTRVQQAIGCVFRFRDERIIRLDGYFSWQEALDAAGIEDPPG